MYRCAVCKGGKRHTAWARECPERKAQVAEAQRAYLTRPTRFQVHTEQKITSQANQRGQTTDKDLDDTSVVEGNP